MYYAYKSRDGHVYCIYEVLFNYALLDDYLLFDSAEECVAYWKDHGVEVDRYV
ncbi:MAG: hypothetical protein J6S14_02165 [Clostridia bacterium]|nr:hypothetical protein [Clostridia bacterium]